MERYRSAALLCMNLESLSFDTRDQHASKSSLCNYQSPILHGLCRALVGFHEAGLHVQAIAYVYELIDGEIKVDKVEFTKA